MKEVLMFQCEICEEIYRNKEECHKCESIGIEKPLGRKGQQIKFYVRVGGGYSHYIEAYIAKVYQHKHWQKYLIKAFDYDGKKYVVEEIWGNNEFKQLCKSMKSNVYVWKPDNK